MGTVGFLSAICKARVRFAPNAQSPTHWMQCSSPPLFRIRKRIRVKPVQGGCVDLMVCRATRSLGAAKTLNNNRLRNIRKNSDLFISAAGTIISQNFKKFHYDDDEETVQLSLSKLPSWIKTPHDVIFILIYKSLINNEV